MQCDDSAKGLPGQSVTLSRFRASSTPKPPLMLTLAHSKVSNARDDTLRHLLRSSHFLFSFKSGRTKHFCLCSSFTWATIILVQTVKIKTHIKPADKQAKQYSRLLEMHNVSTVNGQLGLSLGKSQLKTKWSQLLMESASGSFIISLTVTNREQGSSALSHFAVNTLIKECVCGMWWMDGARLDRHRTEWHRWQANDTGLKLFSHLP